MRKNQTAEQDAINTMYQVRDSLPHTAQGDAGATILGSAILYLMDYPSRKITRYGTTLYRHFTSTGKVAYVSVPE